MVRVNEKEQIISYESSIKKSNEFSMAKLSQGLSLNQMQLLAYAIYCTKKNGITEFHKADFEKRFCIEYKTQHAKEDALKLGATQAQFLDEDLKNDYFEITNISIFRKMRYNKGLFTFQWDSEIVPHILELKEKYVITDLTITAKFKSNFSWTLYDYLKAHYGYWHKPISKEGLMQLFSVENSKSYQTNTALFKRKVLDVAVAEINQYTELEVRYKEIKKGRAIVGFDLIWSNGKAVASATKRQIQELRSILDIVFDDVYQFMNLKNDENREEAIHIVRELEGMKIFSNEPICITKEKANTLLEYANWGIRQLNHFLEVDGRPSVPFYNWLEA